VKVAVLNDGSVFWIPPVNYMIRCQRRDDDVTNCTMTSVFEDGFGIESVIICFTKLFLFILTEFARNNFSFMLIFVLPNYLDYYY